jgi:hypothetical protein
MFYNKITNFEFEMYRPRTLVRMRAVIHFILSGLHRASEKDGR